MDVKFTGKITQHHPASGQQAAQNDWEQAWKLANPISYIASAQIQGVGRCWKMIDLLKHCYFQRLCSLREGHHSKSAYCGAAPMIAGCHGPTVAKLQTQVKYCDASEGSFFLAICWPKAHRWSSCPRCQMENPSLHASKHRGFPCSLLRCVPCPASRLGVSSVLEIQDGAHIVYSTCS